MRMSTQLEPAEAVVLDLLRHIPAPPDDWLALKDIASDAQSVAIATAIVGLLRPFNAILVRRVHGEVRVRAASSSARLFLLSLAAAIDSGFTVVDDWERTGVRPDAFGAQELAQGVQLLYAFEWLRTKDPNAVAVRDAHVVKVIVKTEIDLAPKYLVKYDTKTRGYQLIGGHIAGREVDAIAAIQREIAEELRGNVFRFPDNARLQHIGHVQHTEISETLGALTNYAISYFQLFVGFDLVLHRGDTWVTGEELVAGKASDGTPIKERALEKLFGYLLGGIEALPVGIPRQRTPLLKRLRAEIEQNDSRVNLALGSAGLVATLLGLIFTMCHGTS